MFAPEIPSSPVQCGLPLVGPVATHAWILVAVWVADKRPAATLHQEADKSRYFGA